MFSDPLGVTVLDRAVDGEQRWHSYGVIEGTLLLLVVHTIRDQSESGPVIRVISARRATGKDRRIYENENG